MEYHLAGRIYYATNLVAADGVRTDFDFSFAGVMPDQGFGTLPYLYPEDIKAREEYLDPDNNPVVLDRQVTLIGPNKIRILGEPVVAGRTVRIYRQTETRYPLVDYRDQQAVSEQDLDLSARQAIMIAQETLDATSDNISRDIFGNYDMRGNRLTNVGSAIADADAVTLAQVRAWQATNAMNWRFLNPTSGPGFPATRDNGDPLQDGDMWMDKATGKTYFWLAPAWRGVNVDALAFAAPDGSAMIGHDGLLLRSLPSDTVQKALAAMPHNIWNFSHLCDKPDPNDDTTWDWTNAFQHAANLGGKIHVPSREYIVSFVTLNNSISFEFEPGVRLKQKDNTIKRKDFWTPKVGMFEILVNNIFVEFTGTNWTFDGNAANQEQTEPAGVFLKVQVPASPTPHRTDVRINNPRFVNGTYGYVLVRGDNWNRRFLTTVDVVNPYYAPTLLGFAPGDPATPTPLGWSPTYCMIIDYVQFTQRNAHFVGPKSLPPGRYAPTAVLGTYYGQDWSVSGRCTIMMSGVTRLDYMGRAGRGYDGQLASMNGIGCIDVYGRGEALFVENLVARDCYSIPMRAKASISTYTVLNYDIENCWGGVQVSASSTGPCETSVHIGSGRAKNCGHPVIEVVGTLPTDLIPSAYIGACLIEGTDDRTGRTPVGAMHCRYVNSLTIESPTVKDVSSWGISLIENNNVSIKSPKVDGAKLIGIWGTGNKNLNINDWRVTRIPDGPAIAVAAHTGPVRISDGYSADTFNYGVFVNSPLADVYVHDNIVERVGGIQRGYYSASGFRKLSGNSAYGVQTPVVVATGQRIASKDNSWDPTMSWGGTVPPTTGAWVAGSIVWNQYGVSSAVKYHRCITGGTPGTWETIT